MPAYRSPAEAEIREPVVARLRDLLPNCRIIHEIQCATWGPNRIDVMAVTPERIVSAEIKSSRDKIDRLPAQLSSMHGCSHHAIAALHRKFFKIEASPFGGLMVTEPEEARIGMVWGFDLPESKFAEQYQRHELSHRYEKHMISPPSGALDMLWREELRIIAARKALSTKTSRLTMEELRDLIIWNMTGKQVTREICATLRARKCPEADPQIFTDDEVL